MGLDEMFKAVLENGIVAGLLVVSLWWFAKTAAKREEELKGRTQKLEERLLGLLELTTSHIGKSNVVIEKNTEAIDRLGKIVANHR